MRVMRDTTVETTARKLFDACGASLLGESYAHWSAVVKAWAVGSTRTLDGDDRLAIVYRLHEMDEGAIEFQRALEDEEEMRVYDWLDGQPRDDA